MSSHHAERRSRESKYNVGVSLSDLRSMWIVPPDFPDSLRSQEGARLLASFALRSFRAADYEIDPAERISLDVAPLNFGVWSGILRVSHKVSNRRQKSIVINLARGSGMQSQVVDDDHKLMRDVHGLLPDNTPVIYERATIASPQGNLSMYSSEALGDHYELQWWGGMTMGTDKLNDTIVYKDPRVVHGGISRKGEYGLSQAESLLLLEEMMRLQTEVFIRSGEQIMFSAMVNSGDFILLYDRSSTDTTAMQLVTTRGNLLDPNNTDTRYKGSDQLLGEHSKFKIYRSLPEEEKQKLCFLFSKSFGGSVVEARQALEMFSNSPLTLSARQKYVVNQLLHFEAFPARDEHHGSGALEVQCWPAVRFML